MSNYGTEFKINVHIEPIDGFHMSDYDFTCEFFCKYTNTSRIVLSKGMLKKLNDDNYLALIDSEELGMGTVYCKVTAYIPDSDFDDGIRKEVKTVSSGIIIS